MSKNFRTQLCSYLKIMLQPIADFCISKGIYFQDFLEVAKDCFVSSAQKNLNDNNQEVSISKISVMSGLQRPDVKRLCSDDISSLYSKDLTTRIIGQWLSDKRFQDNKKKPRPLSTQGLDSEFAILVSQISKNLNSHTIRFELERLGLIEHRNNYAYLLKQSYISEGDPKQTLQFACEDVSDLMKATQQNAFLENNLPNLHARTQYDNISDEDLPQIRKWFLKFGAEVHELSRAYLAKFDRDINHTRNKGSGKNRVLLGTFSLIEKAKSIKDVKLKEKK